MSLENRIQKYVQTFPPAVSGSGGQKVLWECALKLVVGFDLTGEQAAAFLLAEWNGRCDPPWTEQEIVRTCERACKLGPAERGKLLEAGEHSRTVKAPAFPLVCSQVNGSRMLDGSQGSETLIPHDDPEWWKSWYEEKREGWKCRYESRVPGVFWVPPSKQPQNWKYSNIYLFDYRTGSGSPYQLWKRIELKERTANGKPKKVFVAYHWDEAKRAFLRGSGGLTPIPFRLADLKKARRVILVEGEKAAWRLNLFLERWFDETDLLTTCFPNGAGSWNDDWKKYFQGKEVFVWPDNDPAGFEYARCAARALRGVAREVNALTKYPSKFPPKADAVEVIDGYDNHYPYSEIKSRDLNGVIEEIFLMEETQNERKSYSKH